MTTTMHTTSHYTPDRSSSSARPERLANRPTVAPRVDIFENAEETLLMFDLPGVAREHLEIQLDKGQLTLHAERTLSEGGSAVSAEFGERDYHRVFTVPRGVDSERIAAELRNGVLALHLPKSAALKPRKIAVSTG